MTVKRANAFPLPLGTPVPLQGRIRECVGLIERGERFLDIGCSSGWLSSYVMAMGFHSYVGIDRVILGIEATSRDVGYVEGSVFALPFEDESFDSTALFDVIEHIPRGSEMQALREVNRVLSKGGKLYISTPHASFVHTPFDPTWCLGHRHYRRRTVAQLLVAAGFTIDRIFVAGGIIELLDHLRLLTYKHLVRQPVPSIGVVTNLIERSHGRDRLLGMTVFAVARRGGSRAD